jgi:hypothetical protein
MKAGLSFCSRWPLTSTSARGDGRRRGPRLDPDMGCGAIPGAR